jgi:hypothetical protein
VLEVSAIGLDHLDLAKHGFQFKARGGCVWQDSLSASDCGAGKFLQFFAGKRACVMAMEAAATPIIGPVSLLSRRENTARRPRPLTRFPRPRA